MERFESCGFRKMMGCKCLFLDDELKMILSVYMGDFKMAGPANDMAKALNMITDSGLELDELVLSGDYLGCSQLEINVTPEDVDETATWHTVAG